MLLKFLPIHCMKGETVLTQCQYITVRKYGIFMSKQCICRVNALSGSLKPLYEAESNTQPAREKQGACVSLSIFRLNIH